MIWIYCLEVASINWQAVAAISTLATGLIILFSVIVIVKQIRELRRAMLAQTFDTVIRHLQNEDMRIARKRVFALNNTPLSEWNVGDIIAAEKYCHSYDTIAIMIRHHLLLKKMFLDNWGDSVDRGSPTVRPLIEKYRRERNAPETWDDYLWLAKEADKHLRKMRTRLSRNT
jgi:hypothetical protein